MTPATWWEPVTACCPLPQPTCPSPCPCIKAMPVPLPPTHACMYPSPQPMHVPAALLQPAAPAPTLPVPAHAWMPTALLQPAAPAPPLPYLPLPMLACLQPCYSYPERHIQLGQLLQDQGLRAAAGAGFRTRACQQRQEQGSGCMCIQFQQGVRASGYDSRQHGA